jgi:fatty acid desaturase
MSSSNDVESALDRPDDTSDASPIFGTVMVLWFLASGIGAGYFAVTRYIGGWPLLSMQVLGFAGAMVVGVLVAGAMVKMIT